MLDVSVLRVSVVRVLDVSCLTRVLDAGCRTVGCRTVGATPRRGGRSPSRGAAGDAADRYARQARRAGVQLILLEQFFFSKACVLQNCRFLQHFNAHLAHESTTVLTLENDIAHTFISGRRRETGATASTKAYWIAGILSGMLLQLLPLLLLTAMLNAMMLKAMMLNAQPSFLAPRR